MQRIRLSIANVNQAVRRSLAALFTAQAGFQVLCESESAAGIDYLQRQQPDVVICGIESYGEKSLAFISTLKEVCPCTMVIVFAEFGGAPHVRAAFMAGADGYLKTPIMPADLVTAVELACRSGNCFFPKEAEDILLKPCDSLVKTEDNGESNIAGGSGRRQDGVPE